MADLLYSLHSLNAVVEERLASTEESLSASETMLLVELLRRSPARPSYLAGRLELSRPRMTQILRRLEKIDLVRGVSDAGDRRAKQFSLTAEGQLAAERGLRRVKELERMVRFSLGRAGAALFSEQLGDLERKLGN